MNIILEEIFDKYNKRPGEIVLVDRFGKHSMCDIVKTAYKIFMELQACGAGVNDVVTIELESSYKFMSSIFACQMIGAVFVPLSDKFPEKRLSAIKQICKAKVSINNDFMENLDIEDSKNSDNAEVKKTQQNQAIDTSKFANKNPESPEMIIFTSGSTGVPKGVVHSLKSLHEAISRMRYNKDWHFIEGLNYTNIAPLTFIMGIQTTLVALTMPICGVTLFLPSLDIISNPKMLIKYLIENKIQNIGLSVKYAKIVPFGITAVKVIYIGSEILSNFYCENIQCINSYGSSELGGGASSFVIDKPYSNTPIGTAMGNLKAYIVDENGKESNNGELCFAGVLPIGYLNNEEQTKKAFIKNPFKAKDGYKRMFKTGDRAIRTNDGIVCIGRLDDMVKINGNRVEVNEINFHLRNIAQIDEVYTKKIVHNNLDFIVTYIKTNSDISDNEIKKTLGDRLPTYMIPHFIVRIDKFPLTTNQKIDENQLPMPNFDSDNESSNCSTSHTSSEQCLHQTQSLVKAYQQVFNTKGITEHSDFVKLGGDSLSAMKIINSVTFDLDVNYIYKYRNPQKIAEALLQEKSLQTTSDNKRQNKDKSYINDKNKTLYKFNNALKIMQRVYNNKEPYKNNVVIYTFAYAVRFSDICADEIVNLVNNMLDTFPMLKANIAEDNYCLYLQRRDKWYPHIKTVALNHKPDESYFKSASKEFTILDKDLFKATIYKYKKYLYLHIALSHFLVDGQSLSYMAYFLINKLSGKQLLASASAKVTDSFEYLDMLEQKHAASAKEDKEYYDKLLNNYDFTLLQNARHTTTHNDKQNSAKNMPDPTYKKIMKDYKIADIEKICKQNRISTSVFFVACFMKALANFTHKQDVCILAYNNGRNNIAGDDSIIGCMFDYFPVMYTFKNGEVNTMDVAKNLSEQIATSKQHHFNFDSFESKIPLDCIIYNYSVYDNASKDTQLDITTKLAFAKKLKFYNLKLDWYASIAVSPKIEKHGNNYLAGISYNKRNYQEADIKTLSDLFWENIELM